VATKTMFLRELKEWGLLVIEYLPGNQMSADILMKNLPGPLFAKHLGYFVSESKIDGVECSLARESAEIEVLPSRIEGEYVVKHHVSGNENDVSLGYKCESTMPDKNKCRHLQTLNQLKQDKNDNAGNCGSKMMSRGNLDEVKKGLDKICGSEGETQLFDMGWMKNG
jgi:hypothetical protein